MKRIRRLVSRSCLGQTRPHVNETLISASLNNGNIHHLSAQKFIMQVEGKVSQGKYERGQKGRRPSGSQVKGETNTVLFSYSSLERLLPWSSLWGAGNDDRRTL